MMFSQILLKLIDEAILPAVFLIAGKVISLFLIVMLLGLRWEISLTSLLPALSFGGSEDLLIANSYSNLVMFFLMALGLIWILTRAHVFHDTHISPPLTLKLLQWNFTSLLTSSFNIFHQAVVWLSYLWLTVILLAIHTLAGINFAWITLLAFTLAIGLTWFFVADVERELTI